MIIEEDVYLEHFGVKGMHWGVRKKREVSAEKQAKRDQKAQKFELKAEKYQTRISEIDVKLARKGMFLGKRALKKEKQNLTKLQARAIKDAEAKHQGKLSTNQKRVIAGAAVAAVIVGAIALHKVQDSGELNRQIVKGKAFLRGNSTSPWQRNNELSRTDLSADDIMSKVIPGINPHYGKIGTKNNCRRATFAYEMRRRGLDVEATRTTSGEGQTFIGLHNAIGYGRKGIAKLETPDLESIAKMPINTDTGSAWHTFGLIGRNKIHATPENAPSKIFQALAREPNGSRGELGVIWDVGGGHSLAYEIINNKPVIFDTQRSKKYGKAMDLAEDFGASIKDSGFTRLDNVPLNENFMHRWVKSAK